MVTLFVDYSIARSIACTIGVAVGVAIRASVDSFIGGTVGSHIVSEVTKSLRESQQLGCEATNRSRSRQRNMLSNEPLRGNPLEDIRVKWTPLESVKLNQQRGGPSPVSLPLLTLIVDSRQWLFTISSQDWTCIDPAVQPLATTLLMKVILLVRYDIDLLLPIPASSEHGLRRALGARPIVPYTGTSGTFV